MTILPNIVDVSVSCTLVTPHGAFEVRVFRIETEPDRIINVPVLTVSPSDGAVVRVNSACLTSETFGDLSCDCKWQLDEAMKAISESKNGVLIYALHHEGRGLGLFHKVRSMNIMQGNGVSSASAFEMLGFPNDMRNYLIAAPIIKWFGIKHINLITNNPLKVGALASSGIDILSRIPSVSNSPSLQLYLHTKAKELGHLIEGAA